jgi:hypothetical protein
VGRGNLRLVLLLWWSLGTITILAQHRSIALAPRTSRTSGLALEILRGADYVSLGPAGFAAVTPSPVLAWRALIEDPEAPTLFQRLLRDASPAGQVYAMAGLYLVDLDAFRAGLPILRSHPSPIRWQDGCIVTDLEHEGAIAWLQNGTLTRRLLATTLRR